MTTVEKIWPGETCVCIGSGPSLAPEDVELVRGRCPVIAINDAYKLAPWADVLYACDQKWWTWHQGVPSFTGPKYAVQSSNPVTWPDVQVLQNTGPLGLELEPTGLRTGFNSGFQAINLAVHLGAARIVLLGYDMKVGANGLTHFFGDHPDRQPSPYAAMLEAFPSIVQPLAALGVAVINCTPGSALKCFPMASLQDELSRLECVA